MPIYEYKCMDCTNEFEELVGVGDSAPPCPSCRSGNTVKMISLISARGITSGCSTCVPSNCSSKHT
ncbi:MAG: zinc ribbon domain-containing protein [bacterium]